jgi:4a-hydroxytetrahydrobiopterin dehydratase
MKLVRDFTFSNFVEAIKFLNKVAVVAEALNHHPEIFLHSYKKVKILLFTYSENKITDKDYFLAHKIDTFF